MEKTKEFIDSLLSGQKETSDLTFSSMMRDKVQTILDIKRVELTSNIYNSSATKTEE